jgi:UDP-N-acetylglucosamine acyltransferase
MEENKIIIGKNNKIANSVIIHNNVIIGDNNFIGENVVIYPNTVIGNNNHIFNGNIIGEMPINSDDSFREYHLEKYKGVFIGDNNLFHVKNLIFSGIEKKTLIQNNNKILGECQVNHDVQIYNDVTFYPRVTAAGFTEFLSYSNVGICAVIHQRRIIGQYSMVGGNNMVTKNVFPYYININNKIHRLNKAKTPEYINNYDNYLREIQENFKNKNFDLSSYDLPLEIVNDLQLFISKIK